MAAAGADRGEEQSCPACLCSFSDPVTLGCGHEFCRVCAELLLKASGLYECPRCRTRATSPPPPPLQGNTTEDGVGDGASPARPGRKDAFTACKYCVRGCVPAVKTCLQCESSMCDVHLKIHNDSLAHVLVEPTTFLRNGRCSVHKEVLKYYCFEHAACVCASCKRDREHEGHQVEPLEEACRKMKEKLRGALRRLTSEREEVEKRARSLEGSKAGIQGEGDRLAETVTVLFNDLREQLDVQEKRVLSEISRQKDEKTLQVSGRIRQLEIRKKMLTEKILQVEDTCGKTDPAAILEGWELKNGDSNTEVEQHQERRRSKGLRAWGYLDEGHVAVTLHQVLVDIMTRVRVGRCAPAAILLDENTAGDYVVLSGDLKTASWSQINQKRQETPERFCFYQVLSTGGFSTGQRYWEVDTSLSGNWTVAMAYPSIDRKGHQAFLGFSDRSWCLSLRDEGYSVMHNSKEKPLRSNSRPQRLGVFLDYEAGRLSFYHLSDPIIHLHTFEATFTEPLHAAFLVEGKGWVKIRS